MALFKHGVAVPDAWLRVAVDGDLPRDGKLLLTTEQWRQHAPTHARPNIAYGLLLQPGTDVDDFAQDYARLELVAINFPKFTDGRGYSMGRMIRERHAFKGELRAIGDVLFDQLQLLARCGFDAFDITNPTTLRLLAEGRQSGITHFYQPGHDPEAPLGTRPWARRPLARIPIK